MSHTEDGNLVLYGTFNIGPEGSIGANTLIYVGTHAINVLGVENVRINDDVVDLTTISRANVKNVFDVTMMPSDQYDILRCISPSNPTIQSPTHLVVVMTGRDLEGAGIQLGSRDWRSIHLAIQGERATEMLTKFGGVRHTHASTTKMVLFDKIFGAQERVSEPA